MTRGKYEKYSWLKRYGLLVLPALFIAVVVGGVSAKYIHQTYGQNVVAAKEFYFTSNLLTEACPEYILNAEATEVSFTLGNHADDLRFSEDEITYTVTVTGGSGTQVIYVNDVVPGSGEVLKLKNGGVTTDTITISGLEKGTVYMVTAVGKAGYQKTLKASFKISDNEENVYKYLDTSNDAYVLLTVWTHNVKGTVAAACDKGSLIPDNTDTILRGVTNFAAGAYGRIQFADDKSFADTTYASRTYRFFVDGATDVTAEDFSVVIDEKYIATTSVPK